MDRDGDTGPVGVGRCHRVHRPLGDSLRRLLFANEADFEQYDAYVKGHEPERTPPGHPAFSQTALPNEDASLYETTSDDGGARQSVDVAGPYYFAVDHSDYRMETRVEEFDDPLTAFVDLKVIRNRSLL